MVNSIIKREYIKDSSLSKSMVKVHLFLLVAKATMVNGMKTILQDLAFIHGEMADVTMANGARIRCMALDIIILKMNESSLENINRIKSKDMA